MEPIKYLYLIRHGESENNVEQTFSGIADIGLTNRGIEQAKKLRTSQLLKKIDEVYTSDLLRAKKTSEIAFGGKFLINETNLLREICFGEYEGKSYSVNDSSDPVVRLWSDAPSILVFPQGDSILEYSMRTYQNILKIVSESEANQIVMVSHSITIRLFVAQLLHLHLDYFRKIPCNNCSITMVKYGNKGLELISSNVLNHLCEI